MNAFRSFLVTLGFIVLPLAVSAAPKALPPPYKSAIVLDAASGNILFEDKADTLGAPASVTKLMTFLVVHDQIAAGTLTLQTPVAITREDAAVGGSQVWLAEGETFSVEDLLFALMIQSANDAAHALARASHGSKEIFVAKMNDRARALGMKQTTFRTPHGLPPTSRKLMEGDVTTARDLALLSRELLLHTDVLHFTSVKERVFRPGQPAPKEVVMRNHNHLLARVRGVDGLKTGFTATAGYCLAATAERDRRRVIVVVMGGPDAKTRDIKVAELIETGFSLAPAASAFISPSESPFVSPTRPSAPAAKPTPTPTPAAPARGDAAPSVRFVPPKS
ncbi:MAG: D-alanyl-D-alanine carboxypeptidase family protein [Opitutaceae bacterium]